MNKKLNKEVRQEALKLAAETVMEAATQRLRVKSCTLYTPKQKATIVKDYGNKIPEKKYEDLRISEPTT